MVQSFTVKLPNMEVRKVEEVELNINDKTYRSLNIYFDNEECDRLIFKDKDVANIEKYKRGVVGTVELIISTENTTKTSQKGNTYITEKTTINIKDFVANE